MLLDSCLQFQVRAQVAGGSSSVGADGSGKMMVSKAEPAAAATSSGSSGPWKIDFTSGEKPATPLLDTVNYPIHMKNLSTSELEQLAAELRAEIVHTVSKASATAPPASRRRWAWPSRGTSSAARTTSSLSSATAP